MGTTCFLIDTSEKTADVIRRENEQTLIPGERSGWTFEFLAMRGAIGYGVMCHQDKDTLAKKYFGIVCKTSRHRTKTPGMTEFCIKDMTEDMGPAYYDAPAKMLDMLDELAPNPPGRYASNWREKCRQQLAQKKQRSTYARGDRVQYGNTAYTLQGPAGKRRGFYVTDESTGASYRMTARQLANSRKLEPKEAPQVFTKQVAAEQFFRDHVHFVHVGG